MPHKFLSGVGGQIDELFIVDATQLVVHLKEIFEIVPLVLNVRSLGDDGHDGVGNKPVGNTNAPGSPFFGPHSEVKRMDGMVAQSILSDQLNGLVGRQVEGKGNKGKVTEFLGHRIPWEKGGADLDAISRCVLRDPIEYDSRPSLGNGEW